jgi:hypothetical protein
MDDQMIRFVASQQRLDSSPIGPVREWRATQFSITGQDAEMHVGLDGESIVVSSPVQIKITI